jgi:phospholipase C
MSKDQSPLNGPLTRRRFLTGAAAAAAGAGILANLPLSVRSAIASAASTTPSFDVSKVKHVVLMMQENRSFDHYFGAMPGVRGFSDPTAITLPSGLSVFHQPSPWNPEGYLLPYHVDATSTSAQSLPSLSHNWTPQHAAWNQGRMDGWVASRVGADGPGIGPYTMAYYEEQDIPFHYALANAFTICDNYHCSVMGPTHPNRLMWMTGTIDPDGNNNGPIIDDVVSPTMTPQPTWTTMAEFLQNAGITWKVYQQLERASSAQPTTPATLASNLNNAGHNMFLAYPNIQNADQTEIGGLYQRAAWGSTLFGGDPSQENQVMAGTSGMTNQLTGEPTDFTMNFEEDCANGTLPQVSWIIHPQAYTEHPNEMPAAGAASIASKLAAIAANQELWESTVFILNYDENDGFFDHVPPITPPVGTPDEFISIHAAAGTEPGLGEPVGSGFRVPCIVVSPWTVGGNVASEPFDATSTLRFIEAVFNGGQSLNTNISDWRRATFGDFTDVFQAGDGAETSPFDQTAPGINTNFTYSTIENNLTTQTANQLLPMPDMPRADQVVPQQPAGTKPAPE